jgi:hypothetical protein
MSESIHVPAENVKPMTGENHFMGAFQTLISHYLQWNRLVSEGKHQEGDEKKQWDEKLPELLHDFKTGLNKHIDERVEEILQKKK